MDLANRTQLNYDRKRLQPGHSRFEQHFVGRGTNLIPDAIFKNPKVFLEIGSGTGQFFVEMAKLHPDTFFIAVERDRMRAKTLVKNTIKLARPNLRGFRGNAIPALMHGIPEQSVDKLFILYPCPWYKTSQRKNRWYLHPAMRHFVRILKPGGEIVWASDQKFYIDEATYLCESHYNLKVTSRIEITRNSNPYASLFPEGRTKFERTFLATGQPVFELIVSKS